MNKTFKIVFNKARGALMVANEITGSVQKKGAIVVGVAAVLSAGIANAATHNSPVCSSDIDDEINVTVSGIGTGAILSLEDSDIVIGNKNTQTTISVTGTGIGNGYIDFGLLTQSKVGAASQHDGGKLTIEGNLLDINLTSKQWANGINSSNLTQNTTKGKATLVINAEQTNINVSSSYNAHDSASAIVAMSEGIIEINGNLKAKATNVITARGHASIAINKSNEKNVQLDGDITFNYDEGTSKTTVDADVLVNLTGSDSYWNGQSYVSWDKKPVDSLLTVNDFTLGLSDGAVWNVSGNSFVNNLNLNGGIINTQGNFVEVKNSLSVNGDSSIANLFVGTDKSSQTASTNRFEIAGLDADTIYAQGGATVNNGTLTISGKYTQTDATLTINESGSLDLSSATINVSKASSGSLILNGGKLTALLGQIYSVGDFAAADTEAVTVRDYLSLNNGTLSITNEGEYTTAALEKLTSAAAGTTLELSNATLATGETAKLIDGIIQGTVDVSLTPTDNKVSIDAGPTRSTGAKSLELSEAASVTINTNLTLIGNAAGGDFIKNATDVTVSAENSLTLGSSRTSATVGTLSNLVLERGTALSINNSSVSTHSLTGGERAFIELGSNDAAGVLHTDTLNLGGAEVFLDPAWQGDDQIADASFLSAAEVTDLSGSIAVGQNSVVALGADKAAAVQGFNKLTDLSWGENGITAALYLGQAVNATGTQIVVNGALTTRPDRVSNGVLIESNGLLMLNQSGIGNNTALSGTTLTLSNGSYVGVINATAGTIALADTVNNDRSTVVTDTPFVIGEISDNTVNLSVSAEGGLGALASTGIQAMTRRADTVLAQTIADRTSVDQELAAGTNLWVDVTGERYEADKLDNSGEFKSDMGYGAFGADFAVTQDITAGAAFQYGKGTLRSSVSSIKNNIDSYGVTAYGAMKFGEAKVVAEASYIKNENDITSSQAALNQSVDSEIYSVGVRGQHRFTAGNFQFVPSVGVRVSRLNTDAMQVGAVNVKKQEQTLVQVPIALRVNGFEQNVNGWSVAPSFKVAYVPTFGDKEISVLGADQTVIDTNPVQGDFGIRAQNGNLMVNANMMLGGGKDGTSSVGGKVGLKYVF